jgi:hypothetical protein
LFSSFVIGNWLLTGPASLTDMQSELRLSGRLSARLASLVEAGLLTCKLAGILTYFQRKVNTKILVAFATISA